MKINNYKKLYIGYWALVIVLVTASCKKEETFDITGDNVNRVYLMTANNTVKGANTLTFSVVNTPIGTKGTVKAALPLQSTMPASGTLNVSVAIDNNIVDVYNTTNKTNYVAVPNGFATVSSSVSIQDGQQVSSDSLRISIPADKLTQMKEKAYLLPVKISSVSGGSDAQVSINQNTIYVIVNISETQLYDRPVLADMTGSIIADRSKWSSTVDKPLRGGSLASMFDGNDQSYFFISSANSNYTVDLGQVVTGISGIRLKSYFDAYGITTANVSTSTDGATWTDYGVANLATGIGAQYIKFYGTVNARYIRLNFTGWQQSLIAPVEFDLYK